MINLNISVNDIKLAMFSKIHEHKKMGFKCDELDSVPHNHFDMLAQAILSKLKPKPIDNGMVEIINKMRDCYAHTEDGSHIPSEEYERKLFNNDRCLS